MLYAGRVEIWVGYVNVKIAFVSHDAPRGTWTLDKVSTTNHDQNKMLLQIS